LTPPQDVRSNVDILSAIAEEMGISMNGDWQDELNKRVAIVA
jgi:hypothetical protein